MENGSAVVCVVVFFFLILLLCVGTGWSNNRTYNRCKRTFTQTSQNMFCKSCTAANCTSLTDRTLSNENELDGCKKKCPCMHRVNCEAKCWSAYKDKQCVIDCKKKHADCSLRLTNCINLCHNI